MTWEELDGERIHVATVNGMQYGMSIGRVTELSCDTDKPFFAVSANGMTKSFSLLLHAKEWIEELYNDIGDAIYTDPLDKECLKEYHMVMS